MKKAKFIVAVVIAALVMSLSFTSCQTKPTEKTCPRCNGKGKIECSRCDGTGRVYSYDMNRYIYCTSCSSGKITCERCQGQGVIFE